VHYVQHTQHGTVISISGTISDRSRGGRPSSVNSIRITDRQIEVTTLVWSNDTRVFSTGPEQCFER
jgi:hypothetical protein